MHKKALVVIDIQNDITKHYRDIIDDLNAAIDWAVEREMDVVYTALVWKLYRWKPELSTMPS